MKCFRVGTYVAFILATVAVSSAQGVDISVDRGRKYQIIEGFGFYPNIAPWKVRQGPFMVDVNLDSTGIYDSLVSDLGATMIRCEIEPEFQADSGIWNYAALQGDHWWFGRFRRFLAAAEQREEPMRLIGQVWSPPGWMKVLGTSGCPGATHTQCRLKEGYEGIFAQHLIKYVETVRDSTGLDFYALSFQDEPNFVHPFNACTYTAIGYRQALTTIVPAFRDAGLQTPFFGAEHMHQWFPSEYEYAIRQDSTALSLIYAWAVHGYEHERNVRADTGSYDGSTPTQKPMWVTSGGARSEDWHDALVQILRLHGFLRNGKGSVWTWWSLMTTDESSDCCLLRNGAPTDMYYTSHHYYRYIRPGTRQIESTTSDTNVHVVAFYHEQYDCMALVLVNSTASSYTVNGIDGAGVPARFERVTSTEAAKVARDSVNAGDDILLPANSITTLVAGTYRGTGDITRIARPANIPTPPRRAPRQTARIRIYGLNGRLVAMYDAHSVHAEHVSLPARCATGVYRIVTEAADGKPTGARTVIQSGR